MDVPVTDNRRVKDETVGPQAKISTSTLKPKEKLAPAKPKKSAKKPKAEAPAGVAVASPVEAAPAPAYAAILYCARCGCCSEDTHLDENHEALFTLTWEECVRTLSARGNGPDVIADHMGADYDDVRAYLAEDAANAEAIEALKAKERAEHQCLEAEARAPGAEALERLAPAPGDRIGQIIAGAAEVLADAREQLEITDRDVKPENVSWTFRAGDWRYKFVRPDGSWVGVDREKRIFFSTPDVGERAAWGAPEAGLAKENDAWSPCIKLMDADQGVCDFLLDTMEDRDRVFAALCEAAGVPLALPDKALRRPEVAHAEVTSAVIEHLATMSPEEVRQTFVRSGILTDAGELAPEYGGPQPNASEEIGREEIRTGHERCHKAIADLMEQLDEQHAARAQEELSAAEYEALGRLWVGALAANMPIEQYVKRLEATRGRVRELLR